MHVGLILPRGCLRLMLTVILAADPICLAAGCSQRFDNRWNDVSAFLIYGECRKWGNSTRSETPRAMAQ
jgi:hypothetical protein